MKNKTIVKLKTSYWKSDRGIHSKRDIIYLKRRCTGYNILEEDCYSTGAEEVFINITNINDCDDGVYHVKAVDISYDWETGYVDDYNLKLIPIEDDC